MRYFFSSILAVCLLLTACHSASYTNESASVARRGDTIVVSSASPVRANLIISSVTAAEYSSSFSTVATVRADAGKLAEVSVPMDGRTGECYVHPGSEVRAGQALFAFHSAEFAEIVRLWYEARSNHDLATRNLARKEALRHEGVVSERELEEARNEAELSRLSLRQAEQSLAVLGVDTAGLQSDGELRIIAPIRGEVMRCEVTNGQFVRSDAESLITIANLSTVRVMAEVKEQYIRSVHSDDRVTIYADAYPEQSFEGQIVHIGGLVDETTRAVSVTIRVANPSHALKPGMYVRAEFTSPERAALIIPSTAIMQGEQCFVYQAVNDSTFLLRRVEVQSVDREHVEVLSGLCAGEHIITKGGFYLAQ